MKYAIARGMGIFGHFRPALNGFFIKAAKVALSPYPAIMKKGKDISVKKLKIPRGDGKYARAYLFMPVSAKTPLPAVVYLHGGGFVFKGAPYHYKLAKTYALRANRAVIFADYKTAEGGNLSQTVSDCKAVYSYAFSACKQLGTDPKKVCLAGDSAGGYLCLSLMRDVLSGLLPAPEKIMLLYPVCDPAMGTKSMAEFENTPMWNAKLNRKMWKICAGGEELYNPFKDGFSRFPPTYIETAEFDCLRDEGANLYSRLLKAGVNCFYNFVKGAVHGYDIRLKSDMARSAIKKRVGFLNSDPMCK